MTEILQAVWFISHYSESPTQNHFKNWRMWWVQYSSTHYQYI
jgi:hypothetical protein